MTGPEHYTEAVRLLAAARDIPSNHDETNPAAALLIAEAHVHATLANAAAIAMSSPNGMARVDFKAWDAVAGVQEG